MFALPPLPRAFERFGTAFALILVGLCLLRTFVSPASADGPTPAPAPVPAPVASATRAKVLCANIDGETDPGDVLSASISRTAGVLSVSAPTSAPGFVIGGRTAFGQVCVTVTYR